MRKYLFLLSILFLVLLAGCRTYQPPQRAAAYMFPSLIPGSAVSSLTAQDVTPEELTAFLDEHSLLNTLDKAGLPREELQIVCRGLNRRGYGEIDARRSGQKLQWLAFMGQRENEIAVSICRGGEVQTILWQRKTGTP
ncbi:MAG: hypothetical protein J6S21_07070 [Victivallales bacterium]|nr:hypothetical protein [Victivallales bacterium]